VGNTPPPSLLIWTLLSIILLIGATGALVWFYVQQYDIWREDLEPKGGSRFRKPAVPRHANAFYASDSEVLLDRIMFRALLPALRAGANRSLLILLVLASVAIGLLYGAGLMWGEHTHISIMEYWRWWVVHLWVEGVFEVFATNQFCTATVCGFYDQPSSGLLVGACRVFRWADAEARLRNR